MKQAFRSLFKSPGFVAVAVLTLAIGMGANTTFFGVLYGVVLRSLPYPQPGELAEIRNQGTTLGNNEGRVSLAQLRDYREHQRAFAGLAAYNIGRVTLNLDDGAERVIRTRVTANLFPLLGVSPVLGRGFTENEESAGNNLVIIVSYAFWQTHLGGTPDAIGRTIRINSTVHTVIGVMPPTFAFGELPADLWQPLDLSPPREQDRADPFLSVIGRRALGVSAVEATSDLQRVARELHSTRPDAYPDEAHWSLVAVPLRESQFGRMFTPLAALSVAAGTVLLIACVNVAIMFLLRAAVRRREIAIRLSLGAGHRHILRQLLAESAIVCALGCVGGALIAVFAVQLLKAFPPAEIPRLQEVALSGPVAAFMVGVLVLVTMLVGVAPAWAVLKTRVTEGLTLSMRVTESRAAVRLREALTVAEIALAVMLLVCGGLAVRSLRELLRDDVGFTTQQLLTFKTNLTDMAYPDRERANRFYEQLTTRIEALPGVAAVAAVSYLPMSGESQVRNVVAAGKNAPQPDAAETSAAAWRVVRGPYFSALGSALRAGRFFNVTDHAGASPVAIVDDRYARRYWRTDADAIGQPLRSSEDRDGTVRTIVGVVHHLKHAGPGGLSLPEVYVPQEQVYQRGMYTVIKTTSAPGGLVPLVRAALAEIDPTVPMYFVETMEQRYASTLALPRFTAGLVSAFSTVALLLAGVGIFGVTAYSVAQRQREFGIRFALGGQRSHVAGLVLRRVVRLALLGGVIGVVGALQLAGLMSSLLFGVQPADLPTLAIAATVIGLTALVASLAPVIRAMRFNPVDVLRAE